ncbi:MAG TPA: flagellin [Verrucomicrobiae bacterium]|nr:flagellin [Verrucomicrobiae bacterium]
MALSILNNIPSLIAENQLSTTNSNLQNTLTQLSSGSRINSGADDAAGLAIANGLEANVTALTQSVANANDGVGALQVADGALGQVTTLLNRAVTLATEASTGTVSSAQRGALDDEYQQILDQIDSIGQNTTFNGATVFDTANTSTTSIFLSDSTTAGTNTIGVSVSALSTTALSLNGTALTGTPGSTGSSDPEATLSAINTAISTVALDRGTIGAGINRLQAASNVLNNEIQNVTAAEDQITAADIPTVVANLSKYSILEQTGISAVAQANTSQQLVLNLLH